ARRKQLGLALVASPPDRPDRMQHVARRQAPAAGRLDVAGFAAAQLAALLEDRRASRAMNRSVDAATAEERGVRGVDDRVDFLHGDVAEDELDHAYAGRGNRTGCSAGRGISPCLNAVAR